MFDTFKKVINGLTYDDGSFEKLGYDDCDPQARIHLEKIFRVFIDGYQIAMKNSDLQKVHNLIEEKFDAHFCGFAFEGAGMYLSINDLLIPWRASRLKAFIEGPAEKHDYICAVGAGFAIARVPMALKRIEAFVKNLKPTIGWCVPDGYGFHQGIFNHRTYIEQCKEAPDNFPDYAKQLFDSGVGRSIWWVNGANPERIKRTIDGFPVARQNELWCAIGLASAYAGSYDKNVIPRLKELSGVYVGDFLSGIPFAARMRQKGKNHSEWTSDVCKDLLNMTNDEAGTYVHETLKNIVGEMGMDLEDENIDFNKFKNSYKLVRDRMKTYFEVSAMNQKKGIDEKAGIR